jgi:hypothetical protein
MAIVSGGNGEVRFTTFVMSCAARAPELELTLERLRACGWLGTPTVVLDQEIGTRPIDRIHHTWRRMIRHAATSDAPFALLLEDDVVFGRWFPHNLRTWPLLAALPPSRAFYASLYNPNRPFFLRRPAQRYMVADPRAVWGAQAIVLTRETARFIDAHWDTASGNPDQRMPLIASRVTSIYFHVPSLVDHAPALSTWGGIEHAAIDFDPDWRAT